jgi:hypothetical protein
MVSEVRQQVADDAVVDVVIKSSIILAKTICP